MRILLTGILLYKVVFKKLLADPLVASFKVFRNEPRMVDKRSVLSIRKWKQVT